MDANYLHYRICQLEESLADRNLADAQCRRDEIIYRVRTAVAELEALPGPEPSPASIVKTALFTSSLGSVVTVDVPMWLACSGPRTTTFRVVCDLPPRSLADPERPICEAWINVSRHRNLVPNEAEYQSVLLCSADQKSDEALRDLFLRPGSANERFMRRQILNLECHDHRAQARADWVMAEQSTVKHLGAEQRAGPALYMPRYMRNTR